MFAIGDDDWPGVAKLIEEAGEVQQVMGKVMGCGGDLDAAWVTVDLRAKITEEVGDLMAAVAFFVATNLDDEDQTAVFDRARFKLATFNGWHRVQGGN